MQDLLLSVLPGQPAGNIVQSSTENVDNSMPSVIEKGAEPTGSFLNILNQSSVLALEGLSSDSVQRSQSLSETDTDAQILPSTGNLLPSEVLEQPVLAINAAKVAETETVQPELASEDIEDSTLVVPGASTMVSFAREGVVKQSVHPEGVNPGAVDIQHGRQQSARTILTPETLATSKSSDADSGDSEALLTKQVAVADLLGESRSVTQDLALSGSVIRDLVRNTATQGQERSLSSVDIKSVDLSQIPMSSLVNGDAAAQPSQKAPVPLSMTTPFGNQPAWSNELGGQIKWMVSQNIQSAELRINPPQLGPVEVRITMHNDQMNLQFASHHAIVRESLESAMPRLREVLGDHGMAQVDVDISEHSFAQQHQESRKEENVAVAHSVNEDAGGNDDAPQVEQTTPLNNGLVDYYA
ncbi:MAG: flagellar hook-length control protein FliK [Gammaproteobacteria bacterium]